MRKRSITLLLAILVLLSLFSSTAIAAKNGTYGPLQYTVSNGKVTITSCSENVSGELVIPATINGYPVTEIGDSAFVFCRKLTRVEIPYGVTRIGMSAFWDCTDLESVVIPSTVTRIVGSAFWCCGLKQAAIPEGVTEIDGLFYHCTSLQAVSLPKSLKVIGSCSFAGCDRLKDVYYAGTNAPKAVAYLNEALVLTDSIHSERADKLSAELGRSQRELLRGPETNAAEGNSWLRYALLTLVAVLIGMAGGWLLARKRQAAVSEQNLLTETADLSAPSDEAAELTHNTENGNAQATSSQENPRLKKENMEFLAKVAELYEQNLKNGRLSIDDLASELCMSRSQFTRRLTATAGMPASNFLNRIRLEKACRLLKDTEKPVSTIAYECGFDDTSYFSNLFKKQYKVTPLQFRILPRTEA